MASALVRLRIVMFGLLGLAVAAVAGCSPPAAPCFPVTGKVTWQKKGLPSGVINFAPDASKGNNLKEGPVGVISPDGTYALKTGDRDGAPLGWYRVYVSPLAPPTEGGAVEKSPISTKKGAPPGPAIPPKYTKPDTSGILIEVTETPKPGAYDIELK